jgi:hypothetical protein
MAYKGKLPPDDFSAKKKDMKYGTTHGFQRALGTAEFHYENPGEPTKSGSIKVHATGSYETLHADDQLSNMETVFKNGETRNYTVGGSSSQTDGHYDANIESTSRLNVKGDHGVSSKTGYVVRTEGQVTAIREFDVKVKTSASESKSFHGSYGDVTEEHSGNHHSSYEKDQVTAVKGNQITMIQEGDHALHVQKGNFDTHIAEKGRIYADNDILIESATKITLKVGKSTIVITSGNIDIISNDKSGTIKIN